MAGQGFASIAEGLARIVDCLACLGCETVHVGPDGTGQSIPPCTGNCVLRVETSSFAPAGGDTKMALLRRGCHTFEHQVNVIYRQCYQTSTKSGVSVPAETRTANAAQLTTTSIAALQALMCCAEPYTNWISFVSADDDPPDGGAAGWTMRLVIHVEWCKPTCDD